MDAGQFPRMTPAEVFGAITANGKRNKRMQADMDVLAWLTGSYTGTGVNAPKKYPKRPMHAEEIMNSVETKEMTDDEMKEVMLAFAKESGDAIRQMRGNKE